MVIDMDWQQYEINIVIFFVFSLVAVASVLAAEMVRDHQRQKRKRSSGEIISKNEMLREQERIKRKLRKEEQANAKRKFQSSKHDRKDT